MIRDRFHRSLLILSMATVVFGGPAGAQSGEQPDSHAAHEAGHDASASAVEGAPVPLYTDLGDHHDAISTRAGNRSSMAQPK